MSHENPPSARVSEKPQPPQEEPVDVVPVDEQQMGVAPADSFRTEHSPPSRTSEASPRPVLARSPEVHQRTGEQPEPGPAPAPRRDSGVVKRPGEGVRKPDAPKEGRGPAIRQLSEVDQRMQRYLHEIRDLRNALGEMYTLHKTLQEVGAQLFGSAQSLQGDLKDLGRGARGQVANRFLKEVLVILNKVRSGRLKDIDEVREEIADILRNQGLIEIEVKPGEPFDANRHKTIGTCPTHDPARDRLIAEVRGTCWRYPDDSPFSDAEVVVYKYTEKSAQA
jgi:molecular chaperone GrpE (heat shock protein)